MPDDAIMTGTIAASASWIAVEVVYAKAEEQALVCLKLPEGSTVAAAIEASGLLDQFPEIDLSVNKVGIFGSVCDLGRILKPNDRVEIYRPLLRDPKDSRKQRAAKK